MNIALFGLILAYIAVAYVILIFIVTYRTWAKLTPYQQSRIEHIDFVKQFIVLIIAIVYITTYYIS